MKKLGKGIKRSMAMGLMHRWQNKDPFAVQVVPWSGERPEGGRVAKRGPLGLGAGLGGGIGLQSRLSAMGQTGGVGMGKIIGFSSSAVSAVGGVKGIEAPKVGGEVKAVEEQK